MILKEKKKLLLFTSSPGVVFIIELIIIELCNFAQEKIYLKIARIFSLKHLTTLVSTFAHFSKDISEKS